MEKSGSWFSYKGDRIGQGRENAKQFLKDNKDIAAKLEAEVRKALGLISVEEKAQGGGRQCRGSAASHAQRPGRTQVAGSRQNRAAVRDRLLLRPRVLPGAGRQIGNCLAPRSEIKSCRA